MSSYTTKPFYITTTKIITEKTEIDVSDEIQRFLSDNYIFLRD